MVSVRVRFIANPDIKHEQRPPNTPPLGTHQTNVQTSVRSCQTLDDKNSPPQMQLYSFAVISVCLISLVL